MRWRAILGALAAVGIIASVLAVSSRLGAATAGPAQTDAQARNAAASATAVGAVQSGGGNGGTAASTGHGGPSPTPRLTPPAASSPPAPSWLTARVVASCVVPGGVQTLVVQSRPGYVVAYNTTYSDGRHGDVDGGEGYSPTNSDGSYRSAWTVSPTAPPGRVTVAVGTQRGTEPPLTVTPTFTVAAHC